LACGKGGRRLLLEFIYDIGRFLGGHNIWPVEKAAVVCCMSLFESLAVFRAVIKYGLIKRRPLVTA